MKALKKGRNFPSFLTHTVLAAWLATCLAAERTWAQSLPTTPTSRGTRPLSVGPAFDGGILLGLPGLADTAGLAPWSQYFSIETEHFRIHFDRPLQSIAEKAAQHLEEAHQTLSKALRSEPWTKTSVLLVDNTDAANGFASPNFRIGMVLYVTPPDSTSGLYFYDDWLRLLCLHEYTHLVNMETTVGPVYSGLRRIFGDGFMPNSLWPSWMLEGLAVYMETRHTQGGRGRAPYWEALLRAAVQENALDEPHFISFDRAVGDPPTFPGGEIPYLFGYYLTQQLAQDTLGEDTLGVYSWRSAQRVPYFINGNLKNITGKTWRDYWNAWVIETRDRQKKNLELLATASLTEEKKLVTGGFDPIGATASPDGQWLAYGIDSADRRPGLSLLNLKTGATRRLDDKLQGSGMAFTPDSRAIVFSALRRRSQFYLHSDLALYDLEKNQWTWLSSHLRAKDPDLSRDGRTLVFTVTANGTTGLGSGNLEKTADGEWKLSDTQTLFMPSPLDRVSNPKLAPDGKSVVFSWHRNGSREEVLARLDRETREIKVLIQNGHTQRFPTFDASGQLYVISDQTGVDNLYRVRELETKESELEQVSNVTSGLWLPVFGPEGRAYGSTLSTQGWNLVEFSPASQPYASQALTLPPIPAPSPAPDPSPAASAVPAVSQPYSFFSSLAPRVWTPFITAQGSRLALGGGAYGFDAVDRHRYGLGLQYDFLVQKPDWFAAYINRSWAPTLTFFAQNKTSVAATDTQGNLVTYLRSSEVAVQAAYTLSHTFRAIRPVLGAQLQRDYQYIPGVSSDVLIASSRAIPSADFRLTYSDSEITRLGISPESGRTAALGARYYLEEGQPLWKALATYREYFRLTPHTILTPSLQAAAVSRQSEFFSGGHVALRGRATSLFSGVPGTGFDGIGIRGYPGQVLLTRQAAVSALDLRFPLVRWFRGWSTHPAFLQNLWGFGFAEATWLPLPESTRGITAGGPRMTSRTLSAAGAGLKTSATVFYRIPVIFSLEYHRGFTQDAGGRGELFATFNLGSLF